MYVILQKECDLMSADKAAKAGAASLFDELLDWLKEILRFLIVTVLICTFVAKPARVEGSSMMPTLVDKDTLILWSLGYEPHQGDIVAANCDGLEKIIIKRVIAVGGQEIYCDFAAGKVYVDGELYEVDGIDNITTDPESNYIYPIIVPKGKYFVMGDNRQRSTDSRSAFVGLIDRDDILGKAVLRIYPFDKFGGLYSHED